MFPWNAVKKFIHTLFEDKSNDMANKVGIFIRSAKTIDEIIEACSNLIQNSTPGGKITTVTEDKLYGGVRVFLNGNDIVKELVGERFLFKKDDTFSTIYPLTTHLTVHDAIFSVTEEEFVDELQKIIQEALGPVLKISKIPISELHPDIGNGNWRVLLNVPEVEDLDVFKMSGLPEHLKVKVPGVHEKLRITFYCTKCEQDGHTQWGCSESTGNGTKAVLDSARKEDSTAKTPNRPSAGFSVQDHEDIRDRGVTPVNKPSLKRRNIKQFESEIGKEEVRNYFGSDSSGIKKEVGESSSSTGNFSRRDDGEPNAKRARISTVMDDDIHSQNLPKASSTTNDADSIEILYDGSSPSKNRSQYFPLATAGGSFFRNSVDDSVSTSNQPAATADAIKSELPSTDENDSDSNQSLSRPKPVRQRKKPAQVIPIVIPDRIQRIISEIDNCVLNVQQLTAFFNHVKKKSKPCQFAEMYTTDVAGLKRQLFEIQNRYYMIPDRGTNVEIQFMKWFVNILDRFDGVPNTRKKKTVVLASGAV